MKLLFPSLPSGSVATLFASSFLASASPLLRISVDFQTCTPPPALPCIISAPKSATTVISFIVLCPPAKTVAHGHSMLHQVDHHPGSGIRDPGSGIRDPESGP